MSCECDFHYDFKVKLCIVLWAVFISLLVVNFGVK